MTTISRFWISLFALFLAAPSAMAVCTWEWQGIYSHWSCPPGDSVGRDFSDIFKAVRDEVSGNCAHAIGKWYEKDWSCISGIDDVFHAGTGIVNIGGTANDCQALFGTALQNINDNCRQDHIQFRNVGNNQGKIARACNRTGIPVRAALAYTKSGQWGSVGYFVIQNNQCADLGRATGPLYLYAESLDGRRQWTPRDYATGNFCVGTGFHLKWSVSNQECEATFPSFYGWRSFGQIKDTNNDGIARFEFR